MQEASLLLGRLVLVDASRHVLPSLLLLLALLLQSEYLLARVGLSDRREHLLVRGLLVFDGGDQQVFVLLGEGFDESLVRRLRRLPNHIRLLMLQPPPLLLLDRLRLLGLTFLVLGGLESVEGHVARHLVGEVKLAQRQLLCVVAVVSPVVLDDRDLDVAPVRTVVGCLSLARAERDQLVGVHLVLNLGCRGRDPSRSPDA